MQLKQVVALCTGILLSLLCLASCASPGNTVLPSGGQTVLDLIAGEIPTEPLDVGASDNVTIDRHAQGEVTFAVKRPVKGWWEAAIRLEVQHAIEEGDVMLLACRMKTDVMGTQDDRPRIMFLLNQGGKGDRNRVLSKGVDVTTEWQTVTFPFVARKTTQAGEAYLVLAVGPMPQNAEIRQLTILNYKKSRRLEDLPRTRFTYKGRAPDAPWRRAAAKRIEKHRKGDLTVTVVGPGGEPIEGATVEVRMQRHAFEFGTMVRADLVAREDQLVYVRGGWRERSLARRASLFGDGDSLDPARNRYLKAVLNDFNCVTLGIALKEKAWEGGSRKAAVPLIEFFNNKGLKVHGHTLIWAWDRQQKNVIPTGAYNLFDDPDGLQAYILEAIRSRMTATRGMIAHWDVINEGVERARYQEIVGLERSVEWFKTARATDPKAGQMLNDFDILNGKNIDAYVKLNRYYLDKGVKLDAVGVQGHTPRAIDIPTVYENLEKLAKLNLPIIVTEFDLSTDDEELQAEYMRDFMTLLFSHPFVAGFYQWGFWEETHWRPKAALYTKDWKARPNLKAYRRLVHGNWTTNDEGVTDAAGRYSTRGFHGDYAVTVRYRNRTAKTAVRLSGEPCRITVMLK
jgi:endo-1,4-beta-xylanase